MERPCHVFYTAATEIIKWMKTHPAAYSNGDNLLEQYHRNPRLT
jgi:hypothetical protein